MKRRNFLKTAGVGAASPAALMPSSAVVTTYAQMQSAMAAGIRTIVLRGTIVVPALTGARQ
jgi:hypothetical protein